MDVLIINHGFPPNPGIGGRRWAKFAKYLAKKGFTVHVLYAKPIPGQPISSWTDDVTQPNIVHHPLPRRYPFDFSPKPTLKSRLVFHFWRLYFNIFSKKRMFDEVVFWEKQLMHKASELIQDHAIRNVMVSGAPFYLFAYAAKLKKRHPDVNLIADYRDPWIGARNYGMESLTEKGLQYEVELQKRAAEQFNWILAPNAFLLAKIQATIPNKPQESFRALSHVYDPDDLPTLQERAKTSNTIDIVYGGSISVGTEPFLHELKVALDDLKVHKPDLYRRLNISFYTSEGYLLEDFLAHDGVFHIHTPVGNMIFEKIKQADFCLILLAEETKNYLITKFAEYGTLKTPFLFIGADGFASDFIKENKLGISLAGSKNFSEDFSEAIVSQATFNAQYDPSQFEASRVTDQLTALFVDWITP
jgi:hypothetical protein